MATLTVEADQLVVTLRGWERAAALRRGVRVPLSAVREVEIEPRPWSSLRGIRAPGTGVPGLIAYGVRRLTGGRPDFAAVLAGRKTLRVELDPPAKFARLLVSVREGDAAVEAIRAARAPAT